MWTATEVFSVCVCVCVCVCVRASQDDHVVSFSSWTDAVRPASGPNLN